MSMAERFTVAQKEKNQFFLNFYFSQAMYREEHMFGVFPVELNDVIVGITMLIASLIQVGQCVVYDVCITINLYMFSLILILVWIIWYSPFSC